MATQQELDATARETQQTIARAEAIIKETEELLAKGEEWRRRHGVSPEKVGKLMSAQTPDLQAQYAKGVKEIQDEIDRDAPKREAETASRARVRPGRQMI